MDSFSQVSYIHDISSDNKKVMLHIGHFNFVTQLKVCNMYRFHQVLWLQLEDISGITLTVKFVLEILNIHAIFSPIRIPVQPVGR